MKINNLKPIDIAKYKDHLVNLGFSPRSINRKLSSLKRFLSFAAKKGYLKKDLLENLTRFSVEANKLSGTPLNSVPEISQFSFAEYNGESEKTDLSGSINISFRFSFSKIKSFLSGIFQPKPKPVLIENYSKEKYAPQLVSQSDWPFWKKILFHLRYTRPSWYKTYHAVPLTHYLHFAILILFVTFVGYGLYNQLFGNVPTPFANPAGTQNVNPTSRLLSFQGRLTDTSGNPITSATNMRFALYNDSAASGAARLWEELRYVEPDTDGIFNVLLGEAISIPATLFSENGDLWLGVTVNRDSEAEPRQQIATVGYAQNAEFLQGHPPSASVSANQIPVMTESGDFYLAQTNPRIYSASGGFKIEGQTLTFETENTGNISIAPDTTGRVLVTSQNTNSNTFDVQNSAITVGNLIYGYGGNDNLGYNLLKLTSGSSETTKFLIDQSGMASASGDFVLGAIDTSPNISTTNMKSLTIGNSSTGAVILAPGGTTALSAYGNDVTVADILTVSGVGIFNSTLSVYGNSIGINNDSDIDNVLSVSSAGTPNTNLYWGDKLLCDYSQTNCGWSTSTSQANYWSIANGTIYPINSTLDFLIGGTSTSSAKFAVLNVDSGTPTASVSAGTSGASYLTANGTLSTTKMLPLTIGGATTGPIQLSPKGTTGLTVDQAGNVGVGTTSPGVGLEVQDNSSSTNIVRYPLYLRSNTTGTASNGFGTGIVFQAEDAGGTNRDLVYLQAIETDTTAGAPIGALAFFTRNAGEGTLEKMRITGGGSVGIGTTDPSSLLELSKATNPSLLITDTTNNAQGKFIVGDTWGAVGMDTAHQFSLRTSGTDRITINSTGNVGIGTTSPGAILDVVGDIRLGATGVNNILNIAAAGSAADSNLYWGDKLLCDYSQTNCGWSTSTSQANYWSIANGTIYPINSTLDFLIGGTSTSSAKFAVLNVDSGTPTASVSAGTSGASYLTANGTLSTTKMLPLTIGGATTGPIQLSPKGTTGLTVDGSGNVGVGTTSPSTALEVNAPASTIGTNQFKLTDGTTGGFFSVSEGTSGASNYLPSFFFVSAGVNGYGGVLLGAMAPAYDVFAGAGGAIVIDARQADNTAIENSHILNIRNAGTSKIVVDKDGKLGIGTTSPVNLLSVAGTASISGVLTVGDGSTNKIQPAGGDLSLMYKSALNTWSPALTVRSPSGNIGIGTTAPDSKLEIADSNQTVLHIDSGNNAFIDLDRQNSSVQSRLRFQTAGSDEFEIGLKGGVSGFHITDGSVNELLTVLSSGNVGIGTTAPSYKLHIKASTSEQNAYQTIQAYDSTNPGLGIRETGILLNSQYSSGVGSAIAKILNTPTANADSNLIFVTRYNSGGEGSSGVEKMRITASGNVGIGTTSPGAVLDVVGDIRLGATGVNNILNIAAAGSAADSNLYWGDKLLCDYSQTNCGWSTSTSQANYWSIANGTIYPINSTLDFLIGGTSTSSAKFAVLNVNDGTPTASVSAGTSGATYLTANGTLATTKMLPLTIGGATTGPIQLSPKGTTGLTVDQAGNVGVGTTGPSGKLQIVGSADNEQLYIVANGTQTSNVVLIEQSGGSDLMRINNNGQMSLPQGGINAGIVMGGDTQLYRNAANVMRTPDTLLVDTGVGIGTTSPYTMLDTSGAIRTTGSTAAGSAAGAGLEIAYIGGATGSRLFSYDRDGGTRLPMTYDATNHYFNINGSEKMRLDSNGYLGIGTTSPANMLDVAGDIRFGDGGGANIIGNWSGVSRTLLTYEYNAGPGNWTKLYTADGTNDYILLEENYGFTIHDASNGDLFRVDTSGNVGIGTTSPSQKLDVVGNLNLSGALSGGYATMSSSLAVGFSGVKAGVGNAAFAGSVGIGTTSPNYPLEVVGTEYLNGDLRIAGNSRKIKYVTNSDLTFQVWDGAADRSILRMDGSGAYFTYGSIGIGTTSPGAVLDVVGDIRLGATGANNILNIAAAGSAADSNLYWGDKLLCNASETDCGWGSGGSSNWQRNDGALSPLNITDDLLVGGTATSSAKFQVFGSGTNAGSASMSGTLTIGQGQSLRSQYGPLNLAYKSAPDTWTTRLTIQDTTGYVGIGTTAPDYPVSILASLSTSANNTFTGTTYQVRDSSGNQRIGIRLKGNNAGISGSAWGQQLYSSGSGPFEIYNQSSGLLVFGTNAAERMRIAKTGEVGIGTTSPTTNLDIGGSASVSANLSFTGAETAHLLNVLDNGTLNIQRSPGGDAGTGLASSMFINAAGNIGIGTTSPANKFDIRGETHVGDGTNYASIDADGDLSFVGSADYLVGANRYAFRYSGDEDYGLYFNASNGRYEFKDGSAANLFTIDVTNGNAYVAGTLGVGTTGADSPLDVLSTSGSQLRLTYTDGSVYTTFNTDSSGNLTINATGTKTIIADDLQVTGNDILDSSATTRLTLGSTNTFSGNLQVNGGLTVDNNWIDVTTYFGLRSDSGIVGIRAGATTGDILMDVGDYVAIRDRDDTYAEDFRFDTDGNSWLNGGSVGIGTTAPGSVFDVNVNGSQMRLSSSGTRIGYFGGTASDNMYIFADSSTALRLGAGNTERMRIESGGDVGIGTTNPSVPLHVYGSSAATLVESGGADTVYFRALNSAGDIRLAANYDGRGLVGTITSDDFGIWTNNTERMTIQADGDIGIGTTSPSYLIDAVASSDADSFRFYGPSTTGEKDMFILEDPDSGGGSQDESSTLKVYRTGAFNVADDGSSLAELTYTGGTGSLGADRQFYTLGRLEDEGTTQWGVSITDSDFWTVGSIRGGATGTNCSGTGQPCFGSPTIALETSGNSYINTGGNVGIGTTAPLDDLDVNGRINQRWNYWFNDFFGTNASNSYSYTQTYNLRDGLHFNNNSSGTSTACRYDMSTSAPYTNGVISFDTRGTSAAYCILDFNDRNAFVNTNNPTMEVMVYFSAITYSDIYIGFSDRINNATGDPSNGVYFKYYTASATPDTWDAVTNGSSTTTTNTGVAPLTSGWQKLRIEVVGTTAYFYIDDTLVATNSTNVPTASLDLDIFYKDTASSQKLMYTDYIKIWQDWPTTEMASSGETEPKLLEELDYTQSADLAETYNISDASSFGIGDIVVSDKEQKGYVKHADSENDPQIIGVVSSTPALTMGGSIGKDLPSVNVALLGRVNVKVSDINGLIQSGDPISSSVISGLGAKSVKPGTIVGRALEDFDINHEVTCPEGTSQNTKCGSVLVAINPIWYDPTIMMDQNGILVDRATGKAVYGELQSENVLAQNITVNDTLTAANKIQTSIIQTGSAVIDSLNTTVAKIVNLTTETFNSGSASIGNLITSTFKADNVEITDKLVSPVVETNLLVADNIETNLIKPISDKIEIQGSASLSGTLTAPIIEAENATITGELTAQNIESQNASIAGTLYANKIVSDEVVTQKVTIVERIQEIIKRITTEDQTQELYAQTTPSASGSASLSYDELLTLLNEAKQDQTNIDSANFSDLNGESLSLSKNLYVYGQANLYEAFVTGKITQGATFEITGGNTVNVLNGTLYLQSFGGSLDIASGAVTIDGSGNAVFAGDLKIKGKLAVNTIKPETNNLEIDLSGFDSSASGTTGFGKLLVRGNLETQGSLSAQDASFSGQLIADSLKLSGDYSATTAGVLIASSQTASQSGILAPSFKTNGTTGVGILPAGETEVVVYNNNVSNNKLIYLTPTSETLNKVVYVKAKKEKNEQSDGYFVVAIDTYVDRDISFNWWIIN